MLDRKVKDQRVKEDIAVAEKARSEVVIHNKPAEKMRVIRSNDKAIWLMQGEESNTLVVCTELDAIEPTCVMLTDQSRK